MSKPGAPKPGSRFKIGRTQSEVAGLAWVHRANAVSDVSPARIGALVPKALQR
jgi:hypothetical protein